MSDKPIDRSAYDAFANECARRRDVCLERIPQLAEDGPTRAEATKLLRVTIHDVVGEARFLGFTDLSETALELTHLLDEAGHQLDNETFRQQLADWVEGLFEAAELSATTVGDAGQSEMLQRLRAALGRARGTRNASDAAGPAGDAGRVIVLDDSEIVRYLLESHLESKGFTALTVESYEQLEERLAAFAPDLVLVDINMPGIKGDEVCRRLRRRQDTRHINIALMSSLSDDELARLAAESGADGFLSKQHGMEELARYLDKLLATLPHNASQGAAQPKAPSVTGASKASGLRGDPTLHSFRPQGTKDASGAAPAAGSLSEALVEAAAKAAVDGEDSDDEAR